MELQRITRGYRRLSEVTRVYRGLHGVTRGNSWLQGRTRPVTGGYNRKLGNYSSLTQQKLISVNRISRKLVFTIKMKNDTNPLRVIYNYIG